MPLRCLPCSKLNLPDDFALKSWGGTLGEKFWWFPFLRKQSMKTRYVILAHFGAASLAKLCEEEPLLGEIFFYSANKGLPIPLGRGVCETKSKNGRPRPRKPFISRAF